MADREIYVRMKCAKGSGEAAFIGDKKKTYNLRPETLGSEMSQPKPGNRTGQRFQRPGREGEGRRGSFRLEITSFSDFPPLM